ncbi:MAG: PD-(D/E)XK nuclease family protein, partial [Bacteroidales bacterium]
MVFPNKRAGLFFNKYLAEISGKPLWAPAFRTINELMQDLSDIHVTENPELVFELYKVFREKTGTTESFDDFYYWGEMLLNDFDDIDKHMVDPDDLFKNLEALKDLEDHLAYLSDEQLEAIRKFWHTLKPRGSASHKTDFIKIWSMLPEIYKAFRIRLKERGSGYEGMIYREVGDKILNNGNPDLEHKFYILVGFNALNPCENLLFSYLKNSG